MAKQAQLKNGALSERLDKATRTMGEFDRKRCILFAKANGISLEFDRLDNGRVAMNVRNAIRTKVKRGEKVVWR